MYEAILQMHRSDNGSWCESKHIFSVSPQRAEHRDLVMRVLKGQSQQFNASNHTSLASSHSSLPGPFQVLIIRVLHWGKQERYGSDQPLDTNTI